MRRTLATAGSARYRAAEQLRDRVWSEQLEVALALDEGAKVGQHRFPVERAQSPAHRVAPRAGVKVVAGLLERISEQLEVGFETASLGEEPDQIEPITT